MTNVVALPGGHIPDENGAVKNVVELLEELLAEARQGAFVTFAAVTVNPQGGVGTGYATSGAPHAHHLVAGAYYLLLRVEKSAGLEV
jgi:hypothetical protein